eukprot:COSAG01_NODE_10522_length_2144_cov_1.611736_3_plen_92_part_00
MDDWSNFIDWSAQMLNYIILALVTLVEFQEKELAAESQNSTSARPSNDHDWQYNQTSRLITEEGLIMQNDDGWSFIDWILYCNYIVFFYAK